MAFEYKNLDKAARDAVRARLNAPDPEPEYETFLTGWEEAHVAHRALRDAALAEGDEDEVTRQEQAIATLEESITNVRAGKRPDGTDRPVRPTPPTPPTPVTPAPVDPAPVTPTPPAPAPTPVQGEQPRKATAKKVSE